MKSATGTHGIRSLIGACLLLLPTGIHVYWSNMSVYALSYIYRGLDSTSDFQFSWIISLALCSKNGMYFFIDSIADVIGPRSTVLGGIAIFNLGMLTSYWSVQTNIAALNATVGGVCGFGAALLYGIVLKCVLPTCRTALGFVTAVIQSAQAIGGIAIIQFVTLYINPCNLAPDRTMKHEVVFFSQTSILSAVPTTFIILGGSTLITQTVGFVLFWKNLSSHSTSKERVTLESSDSDAPLAKVRRSTNPDPNDTVDIELKDMFRSSLMYILMGVTFTSQYAYLVVSYYYKVYGLTYVKDDYLMANLGMAIAIGSIGMRLLNGALQDRLGIKPDLVLVHALFALAAQFFFTAIRINKWFYCIVVALVIGSSSAQLSLITVTTLKTFGKTRFMLKLALVLSPALLTTLMAPPVMQAVIFNWGWFSLATQGAVMTVVNCAIITWCFPHVR